MSTDESKYYDPINGESLLRFHKAKGVKSYACDRCGSLAWSVMNSEAEAPTAALPSAIDRTKANVDLFLPLIVTVCMNCGNVWMTSREIFDRWLTMDGDPVPPPRSAD